MASLSHAPFATPNTQQVPLPKSLPSHLSMDPTSSSSLSSLNQQHSSSDQLSWLQKPSSKLSYFNQLHTMQSSFNHQYSLSSSPNLYEGYLEAVDDPTIEQSFINGGGDDSLLTSSWEALDKLVSASMTPNSGSFNELSDFAPASMHTQSSTSPSPISEVDQKPSNSPYKGGVWANNHDIAHSRRASNVGLNLASLCSADPGFVERAAKFSSYSQQQAFFSCLNQNINNNVLSTDNVDLSNLYTSNALSYIKCPPLHKGDNVGMEVDANSDITAQKPCNNTVPVNKSRSKSPQGSVITTTVSKKKREGTSSMKEGEVDDDEVPNIVAGRWKRAKGGERKDEEEISNGSNMNRKVNKVTMKVQQVQSGGSLSPGELQEQKSGGAKEILSSNKPCNNNNASPKPDFIHVRARRGQATDSHSLAERVRREKISERMKYLQDLVPGCTKVTGKAMMLDEIINYVQSLQRQVEFLSMKLAAVPPSKLEFNFESLFGKEVGQQPIVQNNLSVSFAPETHHTDNLGSYPFPRENMQLQPSPAFPETNPSSSMHSFGSDAALRRTVSMLQAAASSDTFGECISQITDAWDNDFQNMVHLAGFVQTPQNIHPSLEGTLPPGQLKTEL